jgi:hypothetical protein
MKSTLAVQEADPVCAHACKLDDRFNALTAGAAKINLIQPPACAPAELLGELSG